MALGIKKITESVVEDGRSLTMIGTLNGEKINITDNRAIPVGSVIASADGSLRIKAALNQQVKINAATTLKPLSVVTNLINDGAITNPKIANSAVNASKIANNAVQTNHIVNLNVTTAKIADSSITTAKLANGAVTNVKIADTAVRNNHIQNGSVTNNKIADNAVRTNSILDRSVTANKLALGIISNAHMTSNSINTAQIIDLCVTTNKIANKAITLSKLADEVFDYIDNAIKSYVDPLIDSLRKEILNSIPKNLVQHDGLNDIDGTNGSTKLVNIKCTGDIEGNRVFFMTYQDLAEGYVPGELLDAGDIVAMHEDGKVYRAESIDDCIVGVVSDEFANCFGATKEELLNGSKVAVGMIGKVHVKVKGPIKLGQQINISLSDAGIGCGCNSMGIGKALETIDCDFDEINDVLVQIRPM